MKVIIDFQLNTGVKNIQNKINADRVKPRNYQEIHIAVLASERVVSFLEPY